MPELHLLIKYDPSTGALQIGANTPDVMGNTVLAFGMLEAAKVAITQQAAANERRVQPATMLPPQFPGQN